MGVVCTLKIASHKQQTQNYLWSTGLPEYGLWMQEVPGALEVCVGIGLSFRLGERFLGLGSKGEDNIQGTEKYILVVCKGRAQKESLVGLEEVIFK